MGRTASATVKTVAPNLKSSSSARRALATRSSGRARTVDPATVAVSAAPKIEKETEPPARERQVVAVAVVVGALFLAVAVGLLARKGGAADKGDPAPPVTTVDDKKPPPPPPPPPPPAPRPPVPPPPPDPRPPADPPPPVVPDDPDRLDDRRLALLVDAVKHASKLAADDPREALADLDIDKAKAAQDAVSAARDLVKAVSESTGLLQDRITKDRTKARDQLVEVLETIAKVEPTAQDKGGAIAHATRDEAVAWVSAVKAFVALHQHLRGIEDPPGDFAPDESGPGKQYGEFWSKGIVQHLLPAVRLAEKSDWKNALHEADLAHTALRAGFSDDKHVLLEPAYESASAIARLAGEADSRNLTAIAAWESVYDARKDQPLFFRRFVRLGPDRFKGPGFQVPPGWKAEEKGLVAPTTGSASNGALSVGVRGHLAEARLKIDRAAGSVELLDFHPSEQWVFAVPRGWKKVAPQSPVRGMDAPRDQTDVAQDLVFATDDKGGISLKATESGTQVFNGGGFGQPSFHVRGTGFTVKELVLYFVRVPVRKE